MEFAKKTESLQSMRVADDIWAQLRRERLTRLAKCSELPQRPIPANLLPTDPPAVDQDRFLKT